MFPKSFSGRLPNPRNRGEKRCEAAFLSMWDAEKKESLVIDLWTKKMDSGGR